MEDKNFQMALKMQAEGTLNPGVLIKALMAEPANRHMERKYQSSYRRSCLMLPA